MPTASLSIAKQRVSAVITDLDNTLFDWVTIWYQPFKALLDRLGEESGIPQDTLEADAQQVFRRHGTSEYAFLIEELPSLREKHPGGDLVKVYESAISAYADARNRVMEAYPTVIETLQTLKDRGCLLVAYTESLGYYSNYRLRKLGLDRIIDYIYSPPDHELPEGLSKEDLRRYAPDHYTLRRTVARHTPNGVKKPSTDVLLQIVKELAILPGEVIYVGDSLMKDIHMAQAAGITDVWARYGTAQHRDEYELLRRVTHWPQSEVEKEKRLSERDVNPSWILQEHFAELLDRFEFVPFVDRSPTRVAVVVDGWRQTVEVQQHFNDIELKIRNYAITLVVATIGASAFALEKNLQIAIAGVSMPLAAAVLGTGLFAWGAFYGMDRWWYHMLLQGAVKHGLFIEERLRPVFPEFGLTAAIGKSSPLRVGRYQFHSSRKINWFYGLLGTALLCLAIVVLFSKPSDTARTPRDEARADHRQQDSRREDAKKERAATQNELGSDHRPRPGPNVQE